jgi:hypothetical protein
MSRKRLDHVLVFNERYFPARSSTYFNTIMG